MRRRTIGAILACAGLLALGAPAAQAEIADVTTNVCTGTAEVKPNLVTATMRIDVVSSNCKWVNTAVEDNGNPHLNVTDGPYTGGYSTSLVGINVTGTNSFVGTALGYIGGGPVAVVSPNVLNATLVGVNPDAPAATAEEHVGLESCGSGCYRTQVTWTSTFDRIP